MKQSGFIRIIVLVVVLAVIASFLGYNPMVLWSEYVLPFLTFLWGIVVTVIEFSISIVMWIVNLIG